MLAPRPRRPLAAPWLVAVVALVLAACAGPAATPTTATTAPGASVLPGAAIDVDELLASAAAKDGQVVRVTGNFLADEGSARLCAVLMESYPPQCGGGVRLTGEVPADTLAALETTTEPNLKKMWWGYVTLTGTFRAAGADGQPVIEISEISLVEG